VLLDEDSFAYAFRSSGELIQCLENDCENANTHTHGDVHLEMLAHLRRRWRLSGREGLGAGFGAFREVKCLFFTAPETKKRRQKEVTGVTGRWTGR
jgi:hypothetical protein